MVLFVNSSNPSILGYDISSNLNLANQILGKGIVPTVSIIGIICNFLAILIVYLYGIDRAPLVFVVHVSLADFLTTVCNGLLVIRLAVMVVIHLYISSNEIFHLWRWS